MGNLALSGDDIAFLKDKSDKKVSSGEIKKAFDEFTENIDAKGKKMEDVKINLEQFIEKCDYVFNIHSETLRQNREQVYRNLFRAFDSSQVVPLQMKIFIYVSN